MKTSILKYWIATAILLSQNFGHAEVSIISTSPMHEAIRISPVLFSVDASSTMGIQQISLYGNWTGSMQEQVFHNFQQTQQELLSHGEFDTCANDIAEDWDIMDDGSIEYNASCHTNAHGDHYQLITINQAGSWGLFFYQQPEMALSEGYQAQVVYSYYTDSDDPMELEVCNAQHSAVDEQINLGESNSLSQATSGLLSDAITDGFSFTHTEADADMIRVSMSEEGSYLIHSMSLKPVNSDYPTSVNHFTFEVDVPPGQWQWYIVVSDTDGDETSQTFDITVSSGCMDADGDGFGVYPATSQFYGCLYDGIDCDDNNAAVHPLTQEICGDSIDNNCRHGVDEGCSVAADYDGWRVMPVRSQGQWEREELGGRAEQWLQGAARCQSNPDIVYTSHDCGQIWRSIDGGRSWEKPLNIGLWLPMGQSIEVDPINCQRIILIVDNSYDYTHPDYTGIYISEDGGDHWDFVQHGPTLHNRRYEHNVAFAEASVDADGAQRWYAVLYNEVNESNNAAAAIFISNNYGHTWNSGASLSGYNPVYSIQVAPDDSMSVYVATDQGLFHSSDGGATIQSVGDLPDGAQVTSFAIDPNNSSIIWVIVQGTGVTGLYRSQNSGQNFVLQSHSNSFNQSVLDDARHIFMNPGNGSNFYIVPQASSGGRTAIRTTDEGVTYTPVTFNLEDDVRDWRWGVNISGSFAFILISADDDQDVVAQSGGAALYYSEDGLEFVNGSTLYTGANCGLTNYNIAFDASNPQRLATGNADIGMYYSDTGADWFIDRAIPWAWVENDTVPWGSQYTIDMHPDSTDEIIGVAGYVFEKVLVRTTDNGLNWSIVDSNAGHYWRVAYHPQSPDVVYAGDRRSLDGGLHFERFPFPDDLDDSSLQFLDYCRAQPDIIYAGTRNNQRILRSDDRGDNWYIHATASGPLDPFDPILTFAMDPFDCDTIYTLDNAGDLARYDGASWYHLHLLDYLSENVPDDYRTYIRSVQVDPHHPEIVYAGVGSGGDAVIFRTIDAGLYWEDISMNHFRQSISGININPHSGEIMVSGCSGTWVYPPYYATNDAIYDKLPERPSCFDGIRNGDEDGIDCGGRCAACACVDSDLDGYGQNCGGTDADDCRDDDANIHPEAAELCDGIDNDCDGQYDEEWPNLWNVCSVGLGVCKRFGKIQCLSETEAGCTVQAGQPGVEICDGYYDEDCDGVVDNGCDGQTDDSQTDENRMNDNPVSMANNGCNCHTQTNEALMQWLLWGLMGFFIMRKRLQY